MSPGPTNTQMFSRETQAEEALEQTEEALEKSQQMNGALKDALEDIDANAKAMTFNIGVETGQLCKLIADLRTKFADV